MSSSFLFGDCRIVSGSLFRCSKVQTGHINGNANDGEGAKADAIEAHLRTIRHTHFRHCYALQVCRTGNRQDGKSDGY